MNLFHLFDANLVGRPNDAAIEFDGSTLTFGELESRSNRLASVLSERGLVKGARLAFQLANSVGLIDLLLACWKLGAIAVPVNVLYRDREVQHIVTDAEPMMFVDEAALAELCGKAAATGDRRPAVLVEGGDPAAIVYTSGTTGASKGAVLSHNNLSANSTTLISAWQMTPADRLLLTLPLSHVHGLANGVISWLVSGFLLRLTERFDHRVIVDLFRDFRPTLFFGVPTMYVRLLETPPPAAHEIGSMTRLFVSGSAPLAPDVLERFRNLFGHAILERYGMSETLMTVSNPYAGERRAGSIGLPLPGVSIRIFDATGVEGEEGELAVRGPTVFGGYWRREDATRSAFRDGWFLTGDLASRAVDRYLTLRGRKSDLIISGGFNIYPREIEEFLVEQPEIREAAVCGVPDAVRGEVPVAFVIAPDGVDFDSLERRCREQLASFKIPRRFIVVDALPRTALGKVQKHLLRQSLETTA